jgi:DNA polymerase IV
VPRHRARRRLTGGYCEDVTVGKQDGSTRQVSAGEVDDSTATILHVDLDAFFASVELLERPELKGKPVIVAHDGPRSVVTAATYEARAFGVNSAMPLSVAKRRCPDAIVLEPHFHQYQHYSRQVFAIYDEMTPRVERLGIDEAFLDVSGARAAIGSPIEVAGLIRRRVFAETGLIASVGAAATKFVAKLASGLSKPDGLLVIPRETTLDFLYPLPVSALWGVGAKSEATLLNNGLRTVGDVAASPIDTLQRLLGEAAAHKLHELANGRDPRTVETRAEEKSVGHELTFTADVTDERVIRRELLRLSSMVGERLRAAGMSGRTIAIKVRFDDFSSITRSRTITDPTNTGRRIFEEAWASWQALGRNDRPIRLIGVRVEQLAGDGHGAALWDDDEVWREAEGVMDAAAQRFGRGAVTQASLLGLKDSRTIERDLASDARPARSSSVTRGHGPRAENPAARPGVGDLR